MRLLNGAPAASLVIFGINRRRVGVYRLWLGLVLVSNGARALGCICSIYTASAEEPLTAATAAATADWRLSAAVHTDILVTRFRR